MEFKIRELFSEYLMVIIMEKEKKLYFKYFREEGLYMNYFIKIFRKIRILVLKVLNFFGKIIFLVEYIFLVLGMLDKMLYYIIN